MIKIGVLYLTLAFVVFLPECGFAQNKDGDISDIVYHGQVEINDGKIELGYWTRGERPSNNLSGENKFPEFSPEMKVSLNVFNCAGFLASVNGISTYSQELKKHVLDLQILSESVASDATEKIKQCDEAPTSPVVSSGAFAVVKGNNNRLNSKLQNPDLQKTFTSLPQSVQSWANCSEIKNQINCNKKEKNTLSMLAGDDWADTDSDGSIDLIMLSGNCNVHNESGCSRILRLNEGNWVEISYIMPL